jgi:hypothetical protein
MKQSIFLFIIILASNAQTGLVCAKVAGNLRIPWWIILSPLEAVCLFLVVGFIIFAISRPKPGE